MAFISLEIANQLFISPVVDGAYFLGLLLEIISKKSVKPTVQIYWYWLFAWGLIMSRRVRMNSQFAWPSRAIESSKSRPTFSPHSCNEETSGFIDWPVILITGIIDFFTKFWCSCNFRYQILRSRAWSDFRPDLKGWLWHFLHLADLVQINFFLSTWIFIKQFVWTIPIYKN